MKAQWIFLSLSLLFYTMDIFAQDEYEYDYDNPTYNAQHQLHGMQTYTNHDQKAYEHTYANGVLQEAVNYQVMIAGKTPVKGHYQNGKPYSGYFVHAKDPMELYLTDYYEQGQIVAQYAKPLMTFDDKGEVSMHEDYNYEATAVKVPVKSTYEQGKIKDGQQYHFFKLESSAFLMVTETYKQGILHYADLLLGAIHYGELLRLHFLKNGYTITYRGNPERETEDGTLTVIFENKQGKVTMTPNYSFEFSHAPITQKLTPKWGRVDYYRQDDTYYYMQTTEQVMDESFYNSNQSLLKMVFSALQSNVPLLVPNGENAYDALFAQEKKATFHTMLLLIKEGVPFVGTSIEPGTQPHTYSYTKYKKEKVIESRKDLTAEELERLAQLKDKDFNLEE